jgi:D-ribose pyranase
VFHRIFDEPTRGIDINGRREIYRIMEELLEWGVGILMLTSDYTEALEMSHRILIMRNGSICKEYQRGEPTDADILREAIGEFKVNDQIDQPYVVLQEFMQMLIHGILNPQINSLLARVRHTNLLVISDRGFPFWPMLETVDISLVDDIPTVLQVFKAISLNFNIQEIIMAKEFQEFNSLDVRDAFANAAGKRLVTFEAHNDLKKRVPAAIGLIRTADTIQYANMILVSG